MVSSPPQPVGSASKPVASVKDVTHRYGRVIEWATAGQPMTGEVVSGDAAVVETWVDGALVAVIDALGHGPEATEAALLAAELLRRKPGDPLPALMQECHRGLRRSRGIALTLTSFNARDRQMTWSGIGNIEAFLFRRDAVALPR